MSKKLVSYTHISVLSWIDHINHQKEGFHYWSIPIFSKSYIIIFAKTIMHFHRNNHNSQTVQDGWQEDLVDRPHAPKEFPLKPHFVFTTCSGVGMEQMMTPAGEAWWPTMHYFSMSRPDVSFSQCLGNSCQSFITNCETSCTYGILKNPPTAHYLLCLPKVWCFQGPSALCSIWKMFLKCF